MSRKSVLSFRDKRPPCTSLDPLSLAQRTDDSASPLVSLFIQRVIWEFGVNKGSMLDKESEIRPDGKSLGLPDYLIWFGNQLTATAVSAYATLGVGFLEARILLALGQHPNLLATSLVEHLGVDRAAISRALQQLRASGMIVADDRRRLSLSDAGWASRAEVAHMADERLSRFTAGFAEAELEQLLGLLQRLHQNMPELLALNAQLMSAGGRSRWPGDSAAPRAAPDLKR